MPVTGARGTGSVTSSILRVDMHEEILLLEPSATPLTVLSAKLAKAAVHNPKFTWQEDAVATRSTTTSTTGTGTALTVADATILAEHDILKVSRTGEAVRVQSVDSATTITVVRAVGGSAVALVNGDELIKIGSAQQEGDASREAVSSNTTEVTGYTQIFRDSWQSTRTLQQTWQNVRPKDWKHQANKTGIEHKKNIELAGIHGKPSENTSGAQTRRTTGGFLHYVTTNANDPSGAMTEAEFFSYFSAGFRYGSQDVKFGFSARAVVDILNSYPRGKLEVVQADNDATFGVNIMKYRSPHGTLNVVTHNLLEGSTFGAYLLGVDMRAVGYKFLSDPEYGSADTHIRENIQAPDVDGRKDEYLSEVGFAFMEEKRHFYIKNATS
jgi:hypothetical protein